MNVVSALLTLLIAAAAPLQAYCSCAGGAKCSSLLPRRALPRSINNRPIIGVLSQPGDPAPANHSYIAASYIKFVESAGARVIPIMHDYTADEIRDRFASINGVLIPGGGASLKPGHTYYDATALLVKLAMEANDKGDYFPVWGTCLGFEALAVIISGNYSILGDFNAYDAAAPLLFTAAADSSLLFTRLPHRVVHNLRDQALAMENHHKGLSLPAFESSPELRSFFKVLSLSADKDGNPYVSTLEALRYPLTATQWHPEKNAFEWAPHLHIPHTPEAIEVTQEVANFLVSEARRNSHAMADEVQQQGFLIYNWQKHFTGKVEHPGEEKDFEECYFFPDAGLRQQQHADKRLLRQPQV